MSFETLRLLYLALGPGIALAIYIYYSDKWEPEPRLLAVKCFLLGGVAVFPCAYIETLAQANLDVDLDAPGFGWKKLLYLFGVVALVEETAKFLVLKEFLYEDPNFSEPFDGLVYGGMIGCGFASVENLTYVLPHGTEVGILRMLTAVPGHAFNGILMGYFIGIAKFSERPARRFVFGLVTVIALHGLYNTLALSHRTGSFYLFFGVGMLIIFLGLQAKRFLEHHSKILEFCDKEYWLLKKDKTRGPYQLKHLRDMLAAGKIRPEDQVSDAHSGRKLTVKKAIYRELSYQRQDLSKIPPRVRPLWEVFGFYLLTFGFYLYFWFYRNYKDIQNFKRMRLHPELRVLVLFIITILPFYSYGQFLKGSQMGPPFTTGELALILGISGLEAGFIYGLVRRVGKTIHGKTPVSAPPLTVALLFFLLGCLRRAEGFEWFGNWGWELGLLAFQGALLVWVQRDLNRFWAYTRDRLDISKLRC